MNFPLQLDMSPYTTRAHRQNKARLNSHEPPSPKSNLPLTPRSPGWYDLSSVVVHLGKIDAGHYICYCQRDGQWFKFDDSKVTVASEKVVLEAEAYLLFYVIRSLPASEKEKGKNGGEMKDGKKNGESNGANKLERDRESEDELGEVKEEEEEEA